MKNLKIYKQDIRWFLSAVILLLCISCADTDPLINPVIPGGGSDTDVRVTITPAGTSTPRAATRALTDAEHSISEIMLLVFRKNGNDYTFSYMVEGEQITSNTSNAYKTDFTAKLKTSTEPFKILFAANANELFTHYTPAFGDSEEWVRKNITVPFTGGAVSSLPMFGETVRSSLDATEVNRIDVTLLRSVARVDVEVNLDLPKSKDFVIESVHIYRANNNIQVMPDVSAMTQTETLRVKSPSVPDDTGKVPVAYYKTNEGNVGMLIEKLYLPESYHYTTATEMQQDANCVVVGGYYNGETDPTYYRVDFNSGLEGHPFGQVLRNHRYLFTIKQVTGSGWETPGEAADNRSTTIVADIQTWEDFTTGMYVNGDNYFGIDNRELVFAYKAGLKKRIGVESTVPYKIYWDGQDESTAVGIGGNSISNAYFSAQIVTEPGDPQERSYIKITTLSENMSQNNRQSILRVEWANWKFKVDITQMHYTRNILRSVRVLSASAGNTGALGNPGVSSANVGLPMRKKLSNADNFSPKGTVDFFAGFAFVQTPLKEWTGDADGNNQYSAWLTAEVYGSDVVYLANHNLCSPWAARMILDWLEASPRRVLIVGGDHNLTSNGFLLPSLNGLLRDDVDWWFNKTPGGVPENIEKISGTGAYFKYMPNENNQEFFNNEAWFPNVDTSVNIYTVDELFGYAKRLMNEDVIPLIGHVSGDQPVLAINKKRRIIYFGDASIFEGSGHSGRFMTDATTVTNAHDKFFCNLWAWIAHQVIWGDDELIDNI